MRFIGGTPGPQIIRFMVLGRCTCGNEVTFEVEYVTEMGSDFKLARYCAYCGKEWGVHVVVAQVVKP